jgi:hypothetical protein
MFEASTAGADGDGASLQAKIDNARRLIVSALELLDSVQAPPEIGARLQSALDALDENLASKER